MDADSSKRPNVFFDDEPISTTRLATIDIDEDVDEDAPTQRMVSAAPEASDDGSRPTLQSPLPAFLPPNAPREEGPPTMHPLEVAAAWSKKTPRNFRRAIRRIAKRAGIDLRVATIVDLGGGVVAHKIAGTWLFRLPRR